ncbi:MAG: hypothetical protein EBR09_15165 [Proteobacteria bacterium]|nr:hypothetical protein [Pseudomonadota bacterium]
MNHNPENPPRADRILSDAEFAQLMVAEFDAQQNSKRFLSYRRTQLQAALWAASLLIFILIPDGKSLSPDDEFAAGTELQQDVAASLKSNGRNKSGTGQISDLPLIDADFTLIGPETGESYDQQSVDLVTIQIKTRGIRNLRVEVHEDGRLKLIRRLDPLTPPLEQYNEATLGGQTWRYALESGSATLICLKPANGGMPPERLSAAEMIGRAEKYKSQCFYRSL